LTVFSPLAVAALCATPDRLLGLSRFSEWVDAASSGSPALLGVIVASGYGYRREDGVAVIPIGALGP
jgi:uncharacterized protein